MFKVMIKEVNEEETFTNIQFTTLNKDGLVNFLFHQHNAKC